MTALRWMRRMLVANKGYDANVSWANAKQGGWTYRLILRTCPSELVFRI